MAAIPFSLIGIIPAHFALGAFFSATSMIGFMAGAGIVVRNSIILVDFIEQRMARVNRSIKLLLMLEQLVSNQCYFTALAVVVGHRLFLLIPFFRVWQFR